MAIATTAAWLEEALVKLEGKKAREAFDAYVLLVRRCGSSKSLPDARRVHHHLVANGLSANAVLGDLLVQMYGKCGSLDDARAVFDSLPKGRRNSCAWNFIIRAYALYGHGDEAFRLYREMESLRLRPDWYAFSSVLKLCPDLSDLDEAARIHQRAVECGMASKSLVVNTLITMYFRFGELDRARVVFEGASERELFTWNAMIIAYARSGHLDQALEVFRRMDVEPDRVTLSCILGVCSSLGAWEEGRLLHVRADSLGFRSDLVVQTAVVNFYGKCGQPGTARQVFERVPQKSVVTWNSMMAAYVANGSNAEAIQLYHRMVNEGFQPSSSTFASVFHACANVQDFEKGRRIHEQMERYNSDMSNVVVETALLSFYGRCSKLEMARELFDKMQDNNNVISFNAMMAAYASNGHWKETLELYREMTSRGVQPESATYVTALSVCWSVDQLEDGRTIHENIRKNSGARSQVNVQNALVSMYSRCGSLESAKSIFDGMQHRDSVSWNAMVVAYVQHGESREALDTFERMIAAGFEGDAPSCSSALFACSLMDNAEEGHRIHARVMNHPSLQWDSDLHISIINMYTDCGRLEQARLVFENMPTNKDNWRTWNAMITSYAKHDKGGEAMLLLKQMQLQGVRPAGCTFSTVLSVCLGLKQGQGVHALALESGYQFDMVVAGSLIAMYSRCRRIDLARKVFDEMKDRNAVCWTSMMSGYLMEDLPREALKLYHKMDVEPDDITYAVVFGACTNLGDLQVGRGIHRQLVEKNARLGMVGASGLVNMYAKCGKLDVAREVFENMDEGSRSLITWTAIIGGYAQHSKGCEALKLFKRMLLQGVWPDAIAFLSLLISCSQEGGLGLIRGQFLSMLADFGISPIVDHYNCIVDLLGRGGWIKQAEELIDNMPFEPRIIEWTTLLAACRTHVDVDRGGRAAECAFELEPEDTSLYVLLSNLHVAAGMEVEDIETMKKMLANKEFAKRRKSKDLIASERSSDELFVATWFGDLFERYSTANFKHPDDCNNLGNAAKGVNPNSWKMGTLDAEQFKAAALELVKAWSSLGDDSMPLWSWRPSQDWLGPDTAGGYLAMESVPVAASGILSEDIVDEGPTYHIYEYHIMYNESYRVPTLFFNAWLLDGRQLELKQVQQDLPSSSGQELEKSRWTFLTQEDHPYLRTPWFTLHSCGTSDFMKTICSETDLRDGLHYLLTWLSFAGEAAGLKLSADAFTKLWKFKDIGTQ